jgi:phosphate transport system substrate-binding protein
MMQKVLMLVIVALAAPCITAQNSLPPYQSGQAVTGTIRIWGNDRMDTLMKYWQEGFRKYHGEVRFETNLKGTGTGMAGLYTGVADLALMGRAATPKEIQAFQWVFKYKPLAVDVATGSLDAPGNTFAISLFVNKENPLSKLTFTQLDGIFGNEHRRGPRNIRTWGDLGLTGVWTNKPINTYGYDLQTRTALFFKQVLFQGSDKWNCELKEFADLKQSDGSLSDAGQRILKALAQDRYGVAFANLRYVNAQVKPLALAAMDGGPYYLATKENLIQRKYPLTRIASIYVNRAPGKPVDPTVKEFLRYILSYEGQQAILRDGRYLPLSQKAILEQLKELE